MAADLPFGFHIERWITRSTESQQLFLQAWALLGTRTKAIELITESWGQSMISGQTALEVIRANLVLVKSGRWESRDLP